MFSGEEALPDDATGRAPPRISAPAARPPPAAPFPDAVASVPDEGPDAGPPPDAGGDATAEEAARPGPVDLESLRARMPDNLYWELGVPSKDPEVLRRREEQARRWNTLLGKVQANEASEAEIHQYYDHRRAVSEDFITFANQVLEEQGSRLSEEERGLYQLSIQMHRTRLDEIPRQVDDALSRKTLQDKRREDWLRGKNRP
ncbi:MAG: hypothetical protein ABW123_13730 [Cystobacter sp.]